MNQTWLKLTGGSPVIPAQAGVRLMYALIECGIAADAQRPATHYLVLADCSSSMRIPFVDQATFKDIVRHGYANEVMVDGLPVWRLENGIPPEFRSKVKSPIRWLAQAVGSLAERLAAQDRISVLAFSTEVHTLLENAAPATLTQIRTTLQTMHRLKAGDQTVLAPALAQAIQLIQGQQSDLQQRILLLTDGFITDTAASLQQADRCAALQVAISTLGLGFDFEDAVLMGLADRTGGTAQMIQDPAELPQALEAHIDGAVPTMFVQLLLAQGVQLRRAYRIQPVLAPIEQPHSNQQQVEFALDAWETVQSHTVLLELLVPPHEAGTFRLLKAVAGVQGQHSGFVTAHQALIVEYQHAFQDQLTPALKPIVERVTIWRLQQAAFAAIDAGNPHEAISKFTHAATRLEVLGEYSLAAHFYATARELERTGTIPNMKNLRYTTRRLTP